MIPQLILDLWPQVCLLGAFATFVLWNGGIVLGDKDNHIATVHLPQMLYIWPLIVFYSWPVLLPLFSDLHVLRRRLPRLSTAVTFIVLMVAIVNLNTIIHPFTLADNRHYTFYVFRILRKHWLVKYAVVPIYFVCGWLVIGALGRPSDAEPVSRSVHLLRGPDTVCLSFTLVWLLATALSLIAAPLVEPRYFLLPWLMWRLAVPEYLPPSAEMRERRKLERKAASAAASHDHPTTTTASTSPLFSTVQSVLQTAAAYSAWLELAWYVFVNLVTCYLFLYRGFEWPQEPGNVQRFMW